MLVTALLTIYAFLAVILLRFMMRATPKRFIKTLFLGSFLCFVVINMNLFLHTGTGELDYDQPQQVQPVLEPKNQPLNLSNNGNSARNPGEKLEASNVPKDDVVEKSRPFSLNMLNISNTNLYIPVGNNISDMKRYIQEANKRQHILNLDKFDLLASDNTIVIVVQVHNRLEYLKYLIDSLAKSKDIHQTLLIFSHDLFDDEINQLVHTVDFCPVMQIFYPVMMQLHPGEFPDESKDDCPRDIKREEAMKRRCMNAEHPDKYGHYREAKYTQTKHHWFWKINHVFDFLEVTKNFNGQVLLIEEDHYMVEDFVHILRSMQRLREQSCKDCSIFTLGTYDKRPQYYATSRQGIFERIFGLSNQDPPPLVDKVDVMNWISSKHNMGMSFNRAVWNLIRKCSTQFCDFDDYNWDWSLQHVSMQCMPNRLRVMLMKSPRIYHIGECGVHHKGKNCDPGSKVRTIEDLLEKNKNRLYPDALTVAGNPRTPSRMPKPNGGWGDIRDRNMCKSFVTTSPNS